jgi:hypothetical protein
LPLDGRFSRGGTLGASLDGGCELLREDRWVCSRSRSFSMRNGLTSSSNATSRATTCRNVCCTTGGVSAQSSGLISVVDKVSGSDSISLRLPNQALLFTGIFIPRERLQ